MVEGAVFRSGINPSQGKTMTLYGSGQSEKNLVGNADQIGSASPGYEMFLHECLLLFFIGCSNEMRIHSHRLAEL